MCDYSLHAVAFRPAKVGDELITKFFHSLTLGFSEVGEPRVAVCLLPGTEIAFEKDAEYRHPFARLLPSFRFGKLDAKVARFRRINDHAPHAHHDALEFANGRTVLVTRLRPGQRARVLQLPVQAHSAKDEMPSEQHSALVS
jgi:hypothetical protein